MQKTKGKISLKSDRLAGRHPLSLLAFFACILCICMFTRNPVILGIATVFGFLSLACLTGFRKTLKHFKWMLILAVVTAAINPLYNHRGRTVLARFPSGNALTFEAVFYGFTAALILISMITWFACLNYCFDEDKMLYVFGRLSPAVSLTLSMTLRFVPEFLSKARELDRISAGIYKNGESSAKKKRGPLLYLKRKIKVFSALLTWALEGSVKRAEGMRDRGYGRTKRTAYSVFKWTMKDTVFTVVPLVKASAYFFFQYKGAFRFWFYPELYGELLAPKALAGYVLLVILVMLPMVYNYQAVGRHRTSGRNLSRFYMADADTVACPTDRAS